MNSLKMSLAAAILRISDLYSRIDHHRSNAYFRAYQSIQEFTDQHEREPTIEETKSLHYIGESILRDINEFKLTGQITRLEKLEDGASAKLKRSTVDKFRDRLKELDLVFEIAGSYRRGKSYMSDIDIVVKSNDDVYTVVEKIRTKFNIDDISEGDKFYQGWIQLEQDDAVYPWRIDVITADSKSWAAALLYFTGPVGFNIQLRSEAKSIGLKLNRYGLMTQEGSMLPAKDEKQIFEYLNLKYLDPLEREQKLEPISTWIVVSNDEPKFISPGTKIAIASNMRHVYPRLKMLYPEAQFYRIP